MYAAYPSHGVWTYRRYAATIISVRDGEVVVQHDDDQLATDGIDDELGEVNVVHSQLSYVSNWEDSTEFDDIDEVSTEHTGEDAGVMRTRRKGCKNLYH